MLTIPHAPTLSDISAVSYEGLRITTPDGKPATLAVIDDAGHVIEAGHNVELAAWNAAIESFQRFLIGHGHMRVHAAAPGQLVGVKKSVA